MIKTKTIELPNGIKAILTVTETNGNVNITTVVENMDITIGQEFSHVGGRPNDRT